MSKQSKMPKRVDWYFGDFWVAPEVRVLSQADREVYMTTLFLEWHLGGFLPCRTEVEKLLPFRDQILTDAVWALFSSDESGRFYHPKMLRVIRQFLQRSAAGSESAKRRWSNEGRNETGNETGNKMHSKTMLLPVSQSPSLQAPGSTTIIDGDGGILTSLLQKLQTAEYGGFGPKKANLVIQKLREPKEDSLEAWRHWAAAPGGSLPLMSLRMREYGHPDEIPAAPSAKPGWVADRDEHEARELAEDEALDRARREQTERVLRETHEREKDGIPMPPEVKERLKGLTRKLSRDA